MFIICMLLIAAKPKGVVINPLGPSISPNASAHAVDESFIAAQTIQSYLTKQKIPVMLTRKGTYPLSHEDRIAAANQFPKRIALSLSIHPTDDDTPSISLIRLGPIPSSRTEGLFLYPMEKAHMPWLGRSQALMALYVDMFPPNTIAQQIVSSIALWPLYGINHPALWTQWHIPRQLSSPQRQTLIQDWAQRTGLVLQTQMRKDY
jgi:hypothetical protein